MLAGVLKRYMKGKDEYHVHRAGGPKRAERP
jgi:hypothetical protein